MMRKHRNMMFIILGILSGLGMLVILYYVRKDKKVYQ